MLNQKKALWGKGLFRVSHIRPLIIEFFDNISRGICNVRRLSKGATQMAVSVTLYILGLTNNESNNLEDYLDQFLLTILFIKIV